MEKKKQTYSSDFKYKAVQMYQKGEMGYKAIAKKLGVPCHNMIKSWVLKFEGVGRNGLEDQRGKKSKGRPRITKPQSLEEELERLRVEVELLKKIRALKRR